MAPATMISVRVTPATTALDTIGLGRADPDGAGPLLGCPLLPVGPPL
ncbi:MAG: hypothetical protein GF355_10825 [Candidatus Eisenbacteria bacterium]|nr:hypothetical protein [Candidatus Eisenbacteria bacterium]